MNRELANSLRIYALAAVAYGAAVALVFWPFFFTGNHFLANDLFLMLYQPFAGGFPTFQPHNHFDDDILKYYYLYEWSFRQFPYQPYWVPGSFGGIPLYANTYASHFSPLNWLLLFGDLAWMYQFKLLLSNWIAGMACFALARGCGQSGRAAFLSGLAYMFASLFVGLMLRWWLHAPYAWIPLVLLFSVRGLNRFRWADLLLAALFLAFAFADGFFQSSASAVMAVGIFLAVWSWSRGGAKALLAAIAFGCALLVLAFLFSAISLIPQLEYFLGDVAKGGSRAGGGYYAKSLLQRLMSLPLLVAAFFPQAVGSVHTLDLTKLAQSNLQDFSLFLGTIPLLLGITATRLWRQPLVRAFLVLVICGLLVPIATPLDRFFYFRFFAVYLLGMALLAGFGLDSLFRGEEGRRFQTLTRLGAGLLALIFSAGFVLRLVIWVKPGLLEGKARDFMEARYQQSTIGAHHHDWMIERAEAAVRYWSLGDWGYGLPLLVTAVALFLCFLWIRRRLQPGLFYVLAVAVTLLQLGIFAREWHGFYSPKDYPLYPENEVSRFLHQADPRGEYRAYVDYRSAEQVKGKPLIPPNVNVIFGFPTLDGFEGVRPLVVYDLPKEREDYDAFGWLNVRYVIASADAPMNHPALTLRHKQNVAIYENRFARPRGRVFYDYAIEPLDTNAVRLQSRPFSKTQPTVNQPLGFAPQTGRPAKDARLLEGTANRVVYEVESDTPGLFVATESFYPGWRAFWNGEERTVLRAHQALRGVEVPAGKGTLEFRFEPASYAVGLKITLISLGFALVFLLGQGVRCLGFSRRDAAGKAA